MLLISILICSSPVLFSLLRSSRGIKIIMSFYILVFILTQNISKEFVFIVKPPDWLTVLLFAVLILHGMAHTRSYVFHITWIDKLLFIFLFFTIFVPLATNFNSSTFGDSRLLQFFYPIKIWVVYRIFYYLICEYKIYDGDDEVPEFIFNSIIIAGAIAGIIGIARYFPVPILLDFIEKTWPVYSLGEIVKFEHWGRLTSTMSASNGSGNFFAMCLILALYKFNMSKNIIYLLIISLFLACVILTGSYSSFAGLFVGVIIFSLKSLNMKTALSCLLAFIFVLSMIGMSDRLSHEIKRRQIENYTVETAFGGLMPRNLVYRINYWQNHLEVSWRENKMLFGFGMGGIRDYADQHLEENIHTNPESFYLTLILESGFIALFIYLWVNLILFFRISKIYHSSIMKHRLVSMTVIFIMILVMHIANPTIYDGGSIQLFAIFLSLIYFSDKNPVALMTSMTRQCQAVTT